MRVLFGFLCGYSWLLGVFLPTTMFMASGGDRMMADWAEPWLLGFLCAGVPICGLVGAVLWRERNA